MPRTEMQIRRGNLRADQGLIIGLVTIYTIVQIMYMWLAHHNFVFLADDRYTFDWILLFFAAARGAVPMACLYSLKRIVDTDTRKFIAIVLTSVYVFADVTILIYAPLNWYLGCGAMASTGLCTSIEACNTLFFFTLVFFLLDLLNVTFVHKLRRDVNKYLWRPRRIRSIRY